MNSRNIFRDKNARHDIEAFLLGGSFAAAGIYHFINQDFFEAIVPRWFPNPTFANLVSGTAEIFLGLALIPKKSRRQAAWGLLLLLVAVYPANIDMFINDVGFETDEFGKTIRMEDASDVRVRNFVRLPFQFLFGWLIWRHTKKEKISS
ncbi:MAG TPA: hypothetical protein QF762_01545 [Acidimicrobiales bacterium]|nr:hypothetical protein [Acidimicrobiales bacterium]|tara:strand:+ start:91 stop:537 length:447 start_codon:yes stop_codon:yes gene_type:complete